MDRILFLEDDLSLIDGLTFAFEKQGYEVTVAKTVAEAKAVWHEKEYSLLILDVTLPDGTGFDFCKYVRQSSNVPLMFLTAFDEEISIVKGLDIGGDDYITKPFKLGILMSRINALLRRGRSGETGAATLESGGIQVNLQQCQVNKNGTAISLTAAEYRLLCFFMQNPDVVLPKIKILERLWDSSGNFVDDNTLSVYIRRLRMKIEDDPDDPKLIITVRRMGYKWSALS